MNGAPHLLRIMHAMREAGLEAVLIGMAGAAMQGAPVTTDDFDFLVRYTPQTKKKIEEVRARTWHLLRPDAVLSGIESHPRSISDHPGRLPALDSCRPIVRRSSQAQQRRVRR